VPLNKIIMAQNNNLELNDQEIISKIKENSVALGMVYKKCKSSAIQFLRKMNYQSNERIDIEDIFQDAIIVLYENIIYKDFVLASNTSLQTYLNSVCRNQLLKKISKNNSVELNENKGIDEDDQEDAMKFNPLITDTLDEFEDIKEKQFNAIEKALEKIKLAGGHCYELLTLFWYHKKSMNELSEVFGYSNADNTKNQKARCQKRLEKLTFELMNK
jgi:RNA polymerase sigma factor (sigma-70 family)